MEKKRKRIIKREVESSNGNRNKFSFKQAYDYFYSSKKAGIPQGFTPHDFRRQSITEMLANGASLFTVMSIAGHSKAETTKKYVHFNEETIKNQHDLYSPVAKKRNRGRRR